MGRSGSGRGEMTRGVATGVRLKVMGSTGVKDFTGRFILTVKGPAVSFFSASRVRIPFGRIAWGKGVFPLSKPGLGRVRFIWAAIFLKSVTERTGLA